MEHVLSAIEAEVCELAKGLITSGAELITTSLATPALAEPKDESTETATS